MSKNTSVTLGEHFEDFISEQIASGRYSNTSEIIRSGLRLLEEREKKNSALRKALLEGEKSGDAGKLDFEEIKAIARKRAGIDSCEA